MKAGWSSSSPSSDSPNLFDEKRVGRRRSRLCAGGSESDDDSSELDSDEGGSGCGERLTASTIETGRDLRIGE